MTEIPVNLDLYPRQAEAFLSPAQEILFGGATRGGKSHMIRAALSCWCTAVPGLQCLILRKYYDDVIQNHMEGPTSFKAMLAPLIDAGHVKTTENQIRWVHTGSLITLNHCGTDDAAEKNQGIPKNVCVFEEACQILERYIRFIRGWVTVTEELLANVPKEFEGMFPKIFYTANPIGVSMGYFRRNFVKAAEPGTIFRAPEDDGGFLRQYIEAKVDDNPSEDAEATRRRIKGMGSTSISSALLEANWDAPVGDFFPQYDEKRHVVPDFTPPDHWFKFLTFDWGSRDPFAVYWWAVSDGEEFYEGNERFWFPRGSLVAYREWYGCNPENPAEGLMMRNELVAKGIVNRTKEQTSGLVVTDSLPFQDRGMSRNGKQYRIADTFKEHGCPLVRGNTARKTGWAELRDRLIGKDGWPLIYFVESCRYARDYIPAIGTSKNDAEDAVSDGEATHAPDAVRLACTTKPMVTDAPEKPTVKDPTQSSSPQEILKTLKQRKKPGYGARR